MGNQDLPVDILLATHNGVKYIDEQIRSIQRQTFSGWNLLISDDCSSDGTLEKVVGYTELDPRIEVFSSGIRFGSAKKNFLNLLNAARAPYAMFCDQDDVWLPSKVDELISAMNGLEDEYGAKTPLLVFSDMRVVNSELNLISESFARYSKYDPKRVAFRNLIAQNVAAGCSMILNRPLIDIVLKISDRSEDIIMHDWVAMLAASAFGRIGYINKPLNLYRQHGNNEVGARRFSAPRSFLAACENNRDRLSSFYRSSVQAEAFCLTYGDSADSALLRSATAYASIARSSSKIKRVGLLLKSGCWKKGLRKAGQLYDAIMVGSVIGGEECSG